MSKLYNIEKILLGTIYKKENCKLAVDLTIDFSDPADKIMEQLLVFKGSTNLRIAAGRYILVIEGICQDYWEGSMIGLWYAISSCQAARIARVFLINRKQWKLRV